MAEVSFGEWLKRRRGAGGWTQKQLAQQINCSISALRKMEAEERRPSMETIHQLAEVFDIPQEERKPFVRFARGDWQAVSSIETKDAPWRASKVVPRSNLPTSMTSFIGREKEIDEVANLLTKYRLVSLAGAGGVGKSRLSQQVGQKLLNHYLNGVWFVALDSLSDPALVPQTVASVFDIQEGSSDQPLIERLIYSLSQKTSLLIFDNCEHLLGACAKVIKTLLQGCPNLKILVTSRETLNIEGASTYYLSPLSVPEYDKPIEKLIECEAIHLFTERAGLVQSSFGLTTENASSLTQICHRLDGIPLAIELAAARVDILQPYEILRQLNDRLDLLVSNIRAMIPRHQTMRASLDWSWGLLTESEQIFLQKLSVFAGGWILESAKAVCEGDVFNLTSALVKKSLIIVSQELGRETRYHFHKIVRQYAREKLVESNEEENICTQHLKYFLGLSEQAESGLRGPAQIEWHARLTDERDNIRAALGWADKNDVEAGLCISSRLNIFWEFFDVREGVYWLQEFIQKPESKTYPCARASALYTQGRFIYWFQQFAEARTAAQECLDLYRICGNKSGEVDGLLLSAIVGRITQKLKLSQQALALAQSINDKWREAYALFVLCWGYSDRQYIYSYLKKAFGFFQEVGDLRYMAECLAELGRLELINADLESAEKLLKEAAILFRQLNIRSAMSNILQSYGRIAYLRGDYEQAYASLQESAAIDEEYGIRMNYLWTHTHLGYLAVYRGKIAEAREIFAGTVRDFFDDKSEIGVVFTLEGMASLFVEVGKAEIAVKLIGWADATRKQIDDTRPHLEQIAVDKIISACIGKMGEVAFSDAYDEGQKMTLAAAVSSALSEY